MNKYGLIFADEYESITLNQKYIDEKVKMFEYRGNQIYTIHSGIGIANSAAAAQYLISKFGIKKMFNYGAVGASSNLHLFDIIVPKNFYYHSVNLPREWNYNYGQLPQEKPFYINSFSNTQNINIATSDSFVYSEDYLNQIKKNIDVDIFDMESASIAQICHKNDVKFYSVKCVSDIIGKTGANKKNINENIRIAGIKAFEYMLNLMEKENI